MTRRIAPRLTRSRRNRAAFWQRQDRLSDHPSCATRHDFPSAPAGIARIAISTSRRRRRGSSASTIRSAPARRAAASGGRSRIDLERAIPDRSLSIARRRGASRSRPRTARECQRDLHALRRGEGARCEVPVRRAAAGGSGVGDLRRAARARPGEELWKDGLWYGVKGFFDWLETQEPTRCTCACCSAAIAPTPTCPDCRGGRYQPATLNFRFAGKTLPELMAHAGRIELLDADAARGLQRRSALERSRCDAPRRCCDCGEVARVCAISSKSASAISRSIARRARLSGGEVERVNLTTCLGASLVNTLFVLDEPSIGLHPRDTGRLIRVMQRPARQGQHAARRRARGSGDPRRGSPRRARARPRRSRRRTGLQRPARRAAGRRQSRTAARSRANGRRGVPSTARSRPTTSPAQVHSRAGDAPQAARGFVIEGAREHNLRDIDVEIPARRLRVRHRRLRLGQEHARARRALSRICCAAKGRAERRSAGRVPEHHRRAIGSIRSSWWINRRSRARRARRRRFTSASSTHIRELFAATPEALRARAHRERVLVQLRRRPLRALLRQRLREDRDAVPQRRLRALPGVRRAALSAARARRSSSTGKSIHDVLEMTVTRGDSSSLRRKTRARRDASSRPLRVLEEVGLGYLTLGQPLNILSGGESQRLKLVERLTNQQRDELRCSSSTSRRPACTSTTSRCSCASSTGSWSRATALLVIEHNLEVIKCADYVIDLGPEAGARGGLVVATGTPEEVARVRGIAHRPVSARGAWSTSDAQHRTSRRPTKRRCASAEEPPA